MSFLHINPVKEFEKLTREIDSIAKNAMLYDNRPRVEMGGFKPRIDIIENEKSIIFEAELAGVSKENVSISINEENILTIKGEKKFENTENVKTCCRNERAFGQFERSFLLPELVDQNSVEAEYTDGILTLTMQKLEPVKPKETKIEIK